MCRMKMGKGQCNIESGGRTISDSVTDYAMYLVNIGAGELFVNSIDRDGMMNGYDIEFIRMVSNAVSVPVVACGGARTLEDCTEVIKAGASVAAAGNMFVYWG